MSHSYRKMPIFGNKAAASEKADKRHAHHQERVKVRGLLAHASGETDVVVPDRVEAYSEVNAFSKDGKHYESIRVRRDGRNLEAVSVPGELKDSRKLHQTMGK